MRRIDIIGHRGAPEYAPENTLLSFRKAIELGVDWIELDVHETQDGVLVVIHDRWVNRTTSGVGRVSEMTFEEIRRLDAGKGEKVPTLQEVIELARGKVKLNIEVKAPGFEQKLVDIIHENDITDQCMISSFHEESIKRVKQLDPGIMTGVLRERQISWLPYYIYAVKVQLHANAVLLRRQIVKPYMVKLLHVARLKVGIWNVDTVEEMKKVSKMQPDFVFTNYPDRIRLSWRPEKV